jgi:hypothetical protein
VRTVFCKHVSGLNTVVENVRAGLPFCARAKNKLL